MKCQRFCKIIASSVGAWLLVGCAVGPDFKRPAMPDVKDYTATPLPEQTASAPTAFGESQRFVEGGWVNPQWWDELGSLKLDGLIDKALQANPTLAGAQATLRQAHEVYAAQAGSTLYPPTLAASGSESIPVHWGRLATPGNSVFTTPAWGCITSSIWPGATDAPWKP